MESAWSAGHLLGLGVAVEDGGDLVLEHERHGQDALRAAAQPRQGLAGARRLRDVAAHRLLAGCSTLRKIVSAVSGMLMVFTASGLWKPRAYQPMAFWPLTMNIAARSV